MKETSSPPPGIYATVIDVCPYCKGASASGILLPGSGVNPSSGACPVCGGTGRIAGLVPLDKAVLGVLEAYGLLSEADKKKISKAIGRAVRAIASSRQDEESESAIRLVIPEGSSDE